MNEMIIRLIIKYKLLCAKSLQSCPTLCDLMDCSPPGSSSMGFPRQEYWSGLPRPSPGDLPNPGIKPGSPALQVILYHLSHQGSPIHPFSRLLLCT